MAGISRNKNRLSVVAAGVVLYHPSQTMITNMMSYIQSVHEIMIYDNSPAASKTLVESLKNKVAFHYMTSGQNIGIAKALNELATAASAKGYQYLLTMDQDSSFGSSDLKMLQTIANSDSKIGIVTPLHIVEKDCSSEIHGEYEEVLTAMTSGNLLNLQVWKEIGGFDEKLFIDYVDHEYCMRMRLKGYKVIRANTVQLEHAVGELQQRYFFLHTVHPTNHSPFRFFYQTRNRFYLRQIYGKDYPEYFKRDLVMYWRGIAKMLIYENNKWAKLRMTVKGFLAFMRNDFTPLSPTR
jgi:rhamnosyltransferase